MNMNENVEYCGVLHDYLVIYLSRSLFSSLILLALVVVRDN